MKLLALAGLALASCTPAPRTAAGPPQIFVELLLFEVKDASFRFGLVEPRDGLPSATTAAFRASLLADSGYSAVVKGGAYRVGVTPRVLHDEVLRLDLRVTTPGGRSSTTVVVASEQAVEIPVGLEGLVAVVRPWLLHGAGDLRRVADRREREP